jgi:hypothetical protein
MAVLGERLRPNLSSEQHFLRVSVTFEGPHVAQESCKVGAHFQVFRRATAPDGAYYRIVRPDRPATTSPTLQKT